MFYFKYTYICISKIAEMEMTKSRQMLLIKLIVAVIMLYSSLALVFHIRWFVYYLLTGIPGTVPPEQVPAIWFPRQILTNSIFLFVGYQLVNLFIRYQKNGFFDFSALKTFNIAIVSCLSLAGLEAVQIIFNNLSELHLEEWTTINAGLNLLFRSFTTFLVIRDSQTMFLLLAIILWVVKQFVSKALALKAENDSII